MEKTTKTTKSRIYYLDILRILSILGVLFIHATAPNVEKIDFIGTNNWWIANFMNAAFRWAVPVFFMISGALLLNTDKEEDGLGFFFKKRFLKIGIPFLIWSVIYSILKHYYFAPDYPWPKEMLTIIPYELLFDKVYYHFWFVYVIFSVYLTIPIIQPLIRNISEKKLQYFLGMWFCMSIGYELLQTLYLKQTGTTLYISFLNIPLFLGYVGYFVFGYYINTREIGKKLRMFIYALGAGSFVASPFLTYFFTLGETALNDKFLGHFSFTTFFMSIAVFTFFKHMKIQERVKPKMGRLIVSVSDATFGIYLIHCIIQLMIVNYVSTDMNQSPLMLAFMYTVSSTMGFIISYVAVKILSLSKTVKKLLVG